MPLAIRDGPHDGERRAFIAGRLADGADLLVGRGEEERRLDEVGRARAQRKSVSGSGRVEEQVQPVCDRVCRVRGLAIRPRVQHRRGLEGPGA